MSAVTVAALPVWNLLVLLVLSADPTPECGPTRKAPDRTCSSDSDCVAVDQVLDCCGSLATRGISHADAARFQAEEKVCGRELKRCKCAPAPTQLDDGTRVDRRAGVQVACREHVCTSFLAKGLTSTTVKALPECPKASCGPAPASPNWSCPDGVSVGGRGPCVQLEGRCQWSRLECP